MQFEQLFKVMDENGDNTIEPCEIESLLQAYEMWNYEHTYKQTMEELYSDIDQQDSIVVNTAANRFQKTIKILSSPHYELVMNIFTILNLFSVIIQAGGSGSDLTEKWIWIQISVNAILLLETIGDLYISGFIKAYRNHFRIWPETLC